MKLAAARLQRNAGGFRRRVLSDISQALLRYPVQAQGDFIRNRLGLLFYQQLYLDTLSFREFIDVRSKRHGQSEVLQDRRMEIVGDTPDVIGKFRYAVTQ